MSHPPEAADVTTSSSANGIKIKVSKKDDAKQIDPAMDEVQQRIAALRRRPAPTQSIPKPFCYDPDEPLRLPTKTGK
jgi:hypothetical protein